jgi:hypothetical protein
MNWLNFRAKKIREIKLELRLSEIADRQCRKQRLRGDEANYLGSCDESRPCADLCPTIAEASPSIKVLRS